MWDWLNRLIEKHLVDDFPYPPECFDCNAITCVGCSREDDL